MASEYKTLKDCVASGDHLYDCDKDGYCNLCGEQDRPEISDKQYREAAKRLHEREGFLEIDSNAVVSRGADPGAYVQAWVWVYDKDAVREKP